MGKDVYIYIYDRNDSLGDLSPSFIPLQGIEPFYEKEMPCFSNVLNEIYDEDNINGLDLSFPLIKDNIQFFDYINFVFNGKNLSLCNLSNINFKNINMDNMLLTKSVFCKNIFPNKITQTIFDGSIFKKINFSTMIIDTCSFENCIFEDCILSQQLKEQKASINR